MRIDINKQYIIESDEHNFVLKEHKIKKSGENQGEVYYSPLGYYGTLQAGLMGFVKYDTRGANTKNVKELLARLDEIEETIKGIKL